MNDTDDFWGDVPDWDDRPRRSNRPPAAGRPSAVAGLGAMHRRWWDRALSGDSDATRTHGIPRPELHDTADDVPYVDARRDLAPRHGVARRRPEFPDRDPAPHHDLDTAFATGDAEVGRDGIDPLILRVGAVVVTLTLLLPFVSGGDDSTDTITGAPASDLADVSTVPLSPSSAPAPDTGGTPPALGTLLDPATLPPAIPVNEVDDATTDTTPDDETAPSTTDGDEPVGTEVPGDGDPGDGDSGDTDDGDADETPGGGAGASTGSVTGSATADEGADRETRDCAIDYEVVVGDFWLRLAEEAGVPLDDLLDACADYLTVKNRRISFEWAMIDGVNDRPSDAEELAGLCRRLRPRAHVNLIPLNPTPGYPTKGTPLKRVYEFRDRLEDLGANATVRQNRGTDIDAACGQLAAGQPVSVQFSSR